VRPAGARSILSYWEQLSLRTRLVLLATVPQLVYTNVMTWLGNSTLRDALTRLEVELAHHPAAIAALHEIYGADDKLMFVLVSLGLGAITAWFGLRFAAATRARVDLLASSAGQIASGDLDTPVALSGEGELGRLGQTLDQLRVTLSKRIELETEARALEADLDLAATVDRLFLPRRDVASEAGVVFAAYHRPATRCGGDFWWHYTDEARRLWLVVGDVRGTGPGPAMLAGSIVTSLRTLARRGALDDPEKLLRRLHDTIVATSFERRGATLVIVCMDQEEGLTAFSMGAPPLLIARREGRQDVLSLGGLPLGESKLSVVRAHTSFREGDRALLLSTGMLSAELGTGRGLAALRELFSGTSGLDVPRSRDAMGERLRSSANATLEEDVTFVLCGRVPSEAEA
jgi:hypothetical protein